MKKYRFIEPEKILSVMIALIILAVGIFAFMVTVENIPVDIPSGSAVETTVTHTIVDTETYEWIPVSSVAINSTTVCVLEAYGLVSGVTGWWEVQAAGTINGTFIDTNNTFRVEAGTVHTGNTSLRLTYDATGTATDTFDNATYNAIINASGTGSSVFNIIGVIMIISAIMAIIGIVYAYVKPKY